MHGCRTAQAEEHRDEGYVFVGVIILVALLVIFMAVAAPRVRSAIQRDHEIETVHRGQQYIRAVQLYYRRFGHFPPNVDALVDTNGVRFLRRKYTDPLTGQDDWKPVFFGQNHAPLSMGFFGQVLNMGAAVSSSGSPGGSSIIGTPPANAFDSFGNSSSTNGSGSSGQDTSSSPTGALGGAGIMGISPPVAKPSIVVYKTKTQYDEWEFVYDPSIDHMMPMWAPVNGPPTNSGAPGMPTPPRAGR